MLFRQVWLMAVAVGATGQVVRTGSGTGPACAAALKPRRPRRRRRTPSRSMKQTAAAAARSQRKGNPQTEGAIDADKIMAMQRPATRSRTRTARSCCVSAIRRPARVCVTRRRA